MASNVPAAERYRRAHKRWPELTPAQLAAKLGVSDGAVRSALRSGTRRGRPLTGYTAVTIVVPRKLLEYARARLESDGYGQLPDVLTAALAAELVPEAEWLAYQAHVRELEAKPRRS